MNIAVKGISVKENRALENYALDKAEKFYHIFPEIVKVQIELRTETAHKKQDDDFIADITLQIPHKTLKISDSERDLYKAIDKAIDRMMEMLRREKGKKDSRLRLKMNKIVRRGWEYLPEVWHSVNKRVFQRR